VRNVRTSPATTMGRRSGHSSPRGAADPRVEPASLPTGRGGTEPARPRLRTTAKIRTSHEIACMAKLDVSRYRKVATLPPRQYPRNPRPRADGGSACPSAPVPEGLPRRTWHRMRDIVWGSTTVAKTIICRTIGGQPRSGEVCPGRAVPELVPESSPRSRARPTTSGTMVQPSFNATPILSCEARFLFSTRADGPVGHRRRMKILAAHSVARAIFRAPWVERRHPGSIPAYGGV
jgi:hypothetical protein